MLRIAGALLALTLAAACSGAGDPQTTTTREPVEDTTGQVGADPQGTRVSVYGGAYDLCAFMGPVKLAAELGSDASDVGSIADAYARATTEQDRATASAGCLDGLTGQARDPS